MRYFLIFLFLANAAVADSPLSGDEFEALVTGKTLTFAVGETAYGSEYYAPNRQVIWAFVGGDCKNGEWYEAQTNTGPAICFEYEDENTPKCWQVYHEDGQIRADYLNTPGTAALFETTETEPLVCGGAGV